MHYYKFNVADWTLSTAHLSPLEEGVYLRLVNHYYDTEQPIPLETQSVFRRLRLVSEADIARSILAEYFHETADGWVHNRCNEVLAEYQKMAKRNRKNAAKGGRPRKQRPTEKPSGFPVGSDSHPTGIPNQEPLTTNHNEQETASPVVPFQKIVDLYHRLLPTLPRVKKLTDQRRGFIRQRWHEDLTDLEAWEEYFRMVAGSDWLMGRGTPPPGRTLFRADLEWLTRPTNYAKAIEGRYTNVTAQTAGSGTPANTRRRAPHERVRAAAERAAGGEQE